MALIYVVEDDINIQEIETFALGNAGYQVRGFATAKEFMAAIDSVIPDLVLLDVMLPDEDGLSVLKKLRADRATKTVPVIMVTAKTTELDKVKGLDTGADDYVTKPFGVMELISRVKAMLRRSVRHANLTNPLEKGSNTNVATILNTEWIIAISQGVAACSIKDKGYTAFTA